MNNIDNVNIVEQGPNFRSFLRFRPRNRMKFQARIFRGEILDSESERDIKRWWHRRFFSSNWSGKCEIDARNTWTKCLSISILRALALNFSTFPHILQFPASLSSIKFQQAINTKTRPKILPLFFWLFHPLKMPPLKAPYLVSSYFFFSHIGNRPQSLPTQPTWVKSAVCLSWLKSPN